MINIAEYRKAKKLTQAELAQLLGVTQRAVAAYELGERRPSVRTAKAMGAILGFDWPRMFDEKEERQ